MGTAYIRLKFTPVVKYFPRTNSNNCWLEIVPAISCIENLDKIEWSEEKDSVEYIVPVTYKIVVKKREPEHQIRVYYSCIDLLSSQSSVDFSAGDVHRHISDNFILSKANNDVFENKTDLGVKINSKNYDTKVSKKFSNVAYSSISKVKLSDKDNIQVTNTSDDREYKSIEKDNILKEETNESKINKIISNTETDNKNRKNLQKKLCITKVCNINTDDDVSLCNNYANTNFMTIPSFNHSLNRIGLNMQTKNIKMTENYDKPFPDTVFNCFVRVEPEIRIAQFVEKMKREVFPIKVLLNDLLEKCATLGLNKNMASNVPEGNKYMSMKNKDEKHVQKEVQSNRVVYSIVFDR